MKIINLWFVEVNYALITNFKIVFIGQIELQK